MSTGLDGRAEPEEGDLFTHDYAHFYEVGFASCFAVRLHRNCRVCVPVGGDWQTLVEAYMDGQSFWPNVWHVSDHGNVDLVRFVTLKEAS